MLTKEENDFFTRVGAGTPAGEWLRCYWHPIAPANELTDDDPMVHVRVLGEDLVLFKDKSGRVGLVQDRCAHRGASLLYGRVEERGIACGYHGWLYDTEGNCLEQPAEPADSTLCSKVNFQAYPVQRFIGMYWAYMGRAPAPVIPRYKQWVEREDKIGVTVYPNLDCNWLAAAENAVDPAHLQFLHQDAGRMVPVNTTRGNWDDVERFDFYETPYGIMKQRFWKNGTVDEHAFNWPTYLTTGWLRTPIDDEHTMVFIVGEGGGGGGDWAREGANSRREGRNGEGGGGGGGGYGVPDDAPRFELEDAIISYYPAFKDPPEAIHPAARYNLYAGGVIAQDHIMWETQGPISDRTTETLAVSDKGIILLRKLLKEQIINVLEGRDPIGVIRDPDHAPIDPMMGKTRASGIPQEDRVGPFAPRDKVVPKSRLDGNWFRSGAASRQK